MEKIIKLLSSNNREDIEIGLELFVREASYTQYMEVKRQYKEFGLFFLGGEIEDMYYPVNGYLSELSPEQFKRLETRIKKERMMTYTKTKHSNIYKTPNNRYRVRKMKNGRKYSMTFDTIKECLTWLNKY